MRKLTAIIKSIFAVHEAEPTQQTPEPTPEPIQPTTEVTPRPERNETKTFGGVTYTVAELHDFRCWLINELGESDGLYYDSIHYDAIGNAIGDFGWVNNRYSRLSMRVDLDKHSIAYYKNFLELHKIAKSTKYPIECFYDGNIIIKMMDAICNNTINFSGLLNFTGNHTYSGSFDCYAFNDHSTSPYISIPLTKTPDEAKKIIADFEEAHKNYWNIQADRVAGLINAVYDQFPSEFYSIIITDNDGKLERVLTTSEPKQDGTGSYRVSDVIFRPDFFFVFPAIMYKFTVETTTVDKALKLTKGLNSNIVDLVRERLNKNG